MDRAEPKEKTPLVELAPDESVLPALQQSAHPVEFIESNKAGDDQAEGSQAERDAS